MSLETATINSMPNWQPEGDIPFGHDILRPISDSADLGALACIQNLSSSNDDAPGSGAVDDVNYTDFETTGYESGSAQNLN